MKGSKRGFSLMEVMIAMGVLGLVTFGFLQFQKSQANSQKSAEVTNALLAAESRIITVLASQNGCDATLKKVGGFNPAASVSSEFYSDKKTIYVMNDKIDAKGKLLFQGIQFEQSGSNSLMTFKFQKNVNGSTTILKKSFPVEYAYDLAGTKVIGCSSKSEAELVDSQKKAQLEACKNLGGTFDEATQSCVPGLDNICKALGGISNGSSCDNAKVSLDDVTKLAARVAAIEKKLGTDACESNSGTWIDSAKTSCELAGKQTCPFNLPGVVSVKWGSKDPSCIFTDSATPQYTWNPTQPSCLSQQRRNMVAADTILGIRCGDTGGGSTEMASQTPCEKAGGRVENGVCTFSSACPTGWTELKRQYLSKSCGNPDANCRANNEWFQGQYTVDPRAASKPIGCRTGLHVWATTPPTCTYISDCGKVSHGARGSTTLMKAYVNSTCTADSVMAYQCIKNF